MITRLAILKIAFLFYIEMLLNSPFLFFGIEISYCKKIRILFVKKLLHSHR